MTKENREVKTNHQKNSYIRYEGIVNKKDTVIWHQNAGSSKSWRFRCNGSIEILEGCALVNGTNLDEDKNKTVPVKEKEVVKIQAKQTSLLVFISSEDHKE